MALRPPHQIFSFPLQFMVSAKSVLQAELLWARQALSALPLQIRLGYYYLRERKDSSSVQLQVADQLSATAHFTSTIQQILPCWIHAHLLAQPRPQVSVEHPEALLTANP